MAFTTSPSVVNADSFMCQIFDIKSKTIGFSEENPTSDRDVVQSL